MIRGKKRVHISRRRDVRRSAGAISPGADGGKCFLLTDVTFLLYPKTTLSSLRSDESQTRFRSGIGNSCLTGGE